MQVGSRPDFKGICLVCTQIGLHVHGLFIRGEQYSESEEKMKGKRNEPEDGSEDTTQDSKRGKFDEKMELNSGHSTSTRDSSPTVEGLAVQPSQTRSEL